MIPHGVAKDPKDDTTTSHQPEEWFIAANHWGEICKFVDQYSGAPDLHVVDIFGYSRSIAKAWKRRGFRSAAWDIRLCPSMDAVSRAGWFGLLGLCLRLCLVPENV